MDFKRLQRNWENLGKKDPMWAVLTTPGKEGGRWDEAEFYRTGVESIAWLRVWLSNNGIELPAGRALDFGCGAGRLTFALAELFAEVVGVDISEPMIEFARERNRFGERVQLLCNQKDDLGVFADASFAWVMSAIVLQHMRSDYQLNYLREFLRVLRPGGLMLVQLATRELIPPSEEVGAASSDEAHMEMHPVEKARIVALFAEAGGELLVDEPDDWAGPRYESCHFAVRKR